MLCFAIIVALPKSEEVNDLFPLYSDKTPMLTTYRDEVSLLDLRRLEAGTVGLLTLHYSVSL